MNATMTRVAELAMTWVPYYDPTTSPEGTHRLYQPLMVRLDNDGCWNYWITGGVPEYVLRHDGVGWTCAPADRERWADGHVRRLADAGKPQGSFVNALPGVNGEPVELDPAKVYQLRIGYEDDRDVLVLSAMD